MGVDLEFSNNKVHPKRFSKPQFNPNNFNKPVLFLLLPVKNKEVTINVLASLISFVLLSSIGLACSSTIHESLQSLESLHADSRGDSSPWIDESIVTVKVRIQMQKTHSSFIKSIWIKQQIWKRLKKNVLKHVMQTKIASMLKSFGLPVKLKCALF